VFFFYEFWRGSLYLGERRQLPLTFHRGFARAIDAGDKAVGSGGRGQPVSFRSPALGQSLVLTDRSVSHPASETTHRNPVCEEPVSEGVPRLALGR
jgi:hypothetical protein